MCLLNKHFYTEATLRLLLRGGKFRRLALRRSINLTLVFAIVLSIHLISTSLLNDIPIVIAVERTISMLGALSLAAMLIFGLSVTRPTTIRLINDTIEIAKPFKQMQFHNRTMFATIRLRQVNGVAALLVVKFKTGVKEKEKYLVGQKLAAGQSTISTIRII